MITSKALLTVKVLNAKMASQIEILRYDWNESSMYRQIWNELHRVNEGGAAKVYGWASSRYLTEAGKKSTYDFQYWLVHYKGQYFWFGAPDDNSDLGKLHRPGMEQLFVG